MDDLKCLVCFEDATNARSCACPNCGKMFCYGYLTRCLREIGVSTTPCPHCRSARPVQDYLKLNFIDNLRKELIDYKEKFKQVIC